MSVFVNRAKYLFFTATLLVGLLASGSVLAQACYESANNMICETFIGEGGTIDSSSPNYSGQNSVGDTAIGDSESTNYRGESGYQSTDEPRLIFIVDTSAINFGTFTTSSASTANSEFSVLNYTSSGYLILATGNTPTNGSHSLAAMSSTGPSQNGVEQYGVNLVANTSPTSFGANPVQVPSGTFSFGQAASNYNTANNYRYVQGETVATSAESSGQTDFTISHIINVSTTTPGGVYQGNLTLICIGTY